MVIWYLLTLLLSFFSLFSFLFCIIFFVPVEYLSSVYKISLIYQLIPTLRDKTHGILYIPTTKLKTTSFFVICYCLQVYLLEDWSTIICWPSNNPDAYTINPRVDYYYIFVFFVCFVFFFTIPICSVLFIFFIVDVIFILCCYCITLFSCTIVLICSWSYILIYTYTMCTFVNIYLK